MKPFVVVDIDSKEIIFVIQNVIKRVSINDISNAEDFIDEFYKRFKEVNFVPKYNSIDRKDFMNFIFGLKQAKQSHETKSHINEEEQKIISQRSGKNSVPQQETKEKIDLSKSTLVRSNTDRKISVDDLGMKFNEPYDYYDLSIFDAERVEKSAQLKYFLEKGIIVKTSLEEINSFRGKMIAEKEKVKKERQEHKIVNRKDVLGDSDDDGILISSDDYKNAESNSDPIETSKLENFNPEGAAAEVYSLFAQSFSKTNEAKTIDEMLKKS